MAILMAELNKNKTPSTAPLVGDVVNVRVIENLNQIIIINPSPTLNYEAYQSSLIQPTS